VQPDNTCPTTKPDTDAQHGIADGVVDDAGDCRVRAQFEA
jgi:hypothetical protein